MQKLENAPADLGVLLRVEKSVYQCISSYAYLSKWPRTNQDRLSPLLQHETCKARERAARFRRSFARYNGCIQVH
jgi:hypothetical protein